jgi:hypothetical protein
MILIRVLLLALIPVALAQPGTMPTVPCVPALPGCGGPSPVLLTSLLPNLAVFLLRFATGLSLVCVIVAGVQMMLAMGDDSAISKQKWAIFYALAGLVLAILSQAFVSAVATYNYAAGVTPDLIVGGILKLVIDVILTSMNMILVAVIILNGYKKLLAQGKSDEFNKAKQGVLWAIIGAIIINLSYSFVRIVTSLFNL